MIKILLLAVCIAVAYSLPYPDHHEGHVADQGKLLPLANQGKSLPSGLAHSEEKPNLQGKLVPADSINPHVETKESLQPRGLPSKPGDDKEKSDLERSEFFWGGWHRPYYYYSYPTYYYRSYWW